MRRLWLGALVLLSACASSQSAAVPSASATVGHSNNAGVSPSSSPSPLTCSLPFLRTDSNGDIDPKDVTSPEKVGFTQFPGGSFRADPRAGFSADGEGLRSLAQPVLRGASYPNYTVAVPAGISFDRVADRWLPVPQTQVSPDGWQYVYLRRDGSGTNSDAHNALILVNVATGGESALFREPSPTGLAILGFKREGIYVTVLDTKRIGDLPPLYDRLGLHLIDPSTGAERHLIAGSYERGANVDRTWADPGSSAFWTWEWKQGDGSSQLIRVDLASGTRETWFVVANHIQPSLIAVDLGGAPIVEESKTGTYAYEPALQEMWRVGAPGAGQMFYSKNYIGTSGDPLHDVNQVDHHGLWFGSTTGVYLYSAEGFTKVADTPGYPLGDCA